MYNHPKLKLAIAVTFSLLCNSCVIYRSGNMAGTNVPARYDRYVTIVRGDARSISVFGLGGMRKDALVQNARSAMMKVRPLGDNEYYNNYNFTFSRKQVLMVGIDKAVICADVMRHCDSAASDLYTKEYRTMAGLSDADQRFLFASDTFNLGEQVYAVESVEKFYKRPYAIAYFTDTKLYLRPLFKLDKIIHKPLDAIKVFHSNKSILGHSVGDAVNVRDALFQSKFEKGTIVGLNNQEVLLQIGKLFSIVSYERIKTIKP